MNQSTLIPSTMLYRFAIPCHYCETSWSKSGVKLGNEHQVPNFGALDGRQQLGNFWVAWHEDGIFVNCELKGKQQLPWCRDSRLDDSDGLQVWIDTRATHNIHRASRFCHRFVFLPAGGGRRMVEPLSDQLLIERARENANPVRPGVLKVRAQVRKENYRLEGFIPAEALTGYDPSEHPRLGFTYAIVDREVGGQTMTVGSGLRFQEDPSLWSTLELIR